MIGVADLYVVIRLDIRCRYGAFAFFGQHQLGFVFAVENQGYALEIQEDLDNVFLNTLDGRVLVKYAVNFHFRDGTARHGRQQDATQGITQRMAKATLKRLERHLGTGAALLLDLNLAGSK